MEGNANKIMMDQSKIYQLKNVAKKMVAPGKGILAADESIKTVEKRFAAINLENTEENRREFREMLLTAKGMGKYISGVILFDETIRQTASNGKTFVKVLQQEGILPGIKVDEGLIDDPISPTEKLTKGLDGLSNRLNEYVNLGAKFCKWRAVITIGKNTPTNENIQKNAKVLAQYALICQEHGLVPMVEPEVLMDGNHTRKDAQNASEKILSALFEKLQNSDVVVEGIILKTSMVIKGKESKETERPEDVAHATLELFRKVLPKTLVGEAFLSGGQSEIQATQNLNAMHKMGKLPWPLTFSYARALQDSATKVWNGKKENINAAQKVFIHRAKMNSLATLGKYNSMESELE